MKKLFLITIAVIFVSFLSNIQPSQAKADEPKTFIGTIESFRPAFARPPKWPIARFTAVADNGEKIEVYVLGRDTTVTDIDGKSIENKRPQVGKKVEIKYITGEHEIYGGQRYEAISIRYVPTDYVLQSSVATPPSTPQANVPAQSNNILVGKVVKGGVTFSLRCPYRFTIVTDNGETKGIWIPRDGLRITDLNGKPVYGAPPRKGKKMEIKYLIGDNGQYEAVSMRYVPLDYVQQPIAQVSPEKAAPGITAQSNNGLIGQITEITPPGGIGIIKKVPFWRIKFIPDNGGEYRILFITGKTIIIDVDGKTLIGIPESLKKNIKAEVKYSEDTSIFADGKDADSIRYLPDQQPIAPTAPIQATQETTTRPENIFTGTVEKITPTIGRGPEEPRCKILVVADNGEKSLFFVPKNSPVTDATGRDMSEGGRIGGLLLKKGQRIEVKYSIITNGSVITNGQNGAVSIRCLD